MIVDPEYSLIFRDLDSYDVHFCGGLEETARGPFDMHRPQAEVELLLESAGSIKS